MNYFDGTARTPRLRSPTPIMALDYTASRGGGGGGGRGPQGRTSLPSREGQQCCKGALRYTAERLRSLYL